MTKNLWIIPLLINMMVHPIKSIKSEDLQEILIQILHQFLSVIDILKMTLVEENQNLNEKRK